jgi:hypothetical protein
MHTPQATIRRLRNGVVPGWEVGRLSVGYDKAKSAMNLSLSALDLPGHLTPLFVRGEWGTGKTHFLSYVRSVAADASIANARVDLNARDAALNYPQRFLRSIAESMKVLEFEGIKSILLWLVEDPSTRSRLVEFAKGSEAGDLRWSLADFCQQLEMGKSIDLSDHMIWGYLHGIDLSWSDSQDKRDRAIARIGSIALLLRAVGLRGLVLVLDEAETIDQLWNIRSRISGYSVMERIFQLDAVWCVLGTTMRFDNTIARDLENGILSHDFDSPEAEMFLKRWRKQQFQFFEPPTIDVRSARKLAGIICEFYEMAYGRIRDVDGLAESCVAEWSSNPGRNPRRLIRLIIHRIDVRRALPSQTQAA